MNIWNELREEGYNVSPLKWSCRKIGEGLVLKWVQISDIHIEEVEYLEKKLESELDFLHHRSVFINPRGSFSMNVYWEFEGTEDDWDWVRQDRLDTISRHLESE